MMVQDLRTDAVFGCNHLRWWWLPWLMGFLFLSGAACGAAGVNISAALDPQFVTLGESASLSISFQGTSQQPAPPVPEVPNLQIRYLGPASQVSIVNGQVSATVTHKYSVTALAPGDYSIPAIRAEVGGSVVSTSPLQLRVLKPEAPSRQTVEKTGQVAFLKIVIPKSELYEGEAIGAELQLHVRAEIQGLEDFQMTGFPTDGAVTGKLVQGRQRQVRIGNFTYNVIPLAFPLRAVRSGQISMGPATATLVVQLPARGRRDPLDFFNFGERKQISIASEAVTLEGLALPKDAIPASFSGAVGKFKMSVSAGPTNVAVGDPITVRVQISGTGSFETLNLPEQTGWKNFKLYPPMSQTESSDALGLQATKTFEQIVAPESADISLLPAFSFSYFDPEVKAYRTLMQPPLPLTVRPVGAEPLPSVVSPDSSRKDPENRGREIVHIKPRAGALAQVQIPILQRPWFLGLQFAPVLAVLAGWVWRLQRERLARNPRLVRSRRLNEVLREGVSQLRRTAGENQPDAFFSLLFHLLQELLGERLDLPASAITEAVIAEHLRPRGVDDSVLNPLQELFQACNLAKYAPVRSRQELSALVIEFENVASELRKMKL